MSLLHEPGFDFVELQLDAVLIIGPQNVRYLTGYTGSNGFVLLSAKGEPVFYTDPRYAVQSGQEVSCKTRIIPRGGLLAGVAKDIQRRRLRRIGFEKSHFTLDLYETLKDLVDTRTELFGVPDFVAQRRMIKDAAELEAIRSSVAINSAAFNRVLSKIRPGLTESEVAAEIEYQMRHLGAEKPSFETIVASAERTALPHANPTNRKLKGDELLLIDMGAFRSGYASDMTRTLHLGRPPAKIRRMYEAVLEAQLAGIDAVRDGATAEGVDRATRRVLKQHDLDRAFTHSTGHGLGLEIHEAPRLGKGDKTVLRTGMAITIEPGVYIENLGGIRIEDTVVVTKTGCEVLTPTTKELLSL